MSKSKRDIVLTLAQALLLEFGNGEEWETIDRHQQDIWLWSAAEVIDGLELTGLQITEA